MNNVIVIVPAHNEETSIQGVILSLFKAKKAGAIKDFIIVPNGCTDKTVEIIKKTKAHMIELSVANKGSAFIEGVRWAHSTKADIVVTLDADMLPFRPEQITALVKPVVDKKTIMAVGRYVNNQGFMNETYSGLRAFPIRALNPIIAGNKEWLRQLTISPLGLETILNEKFFGAPLTRLRYKNPNTFVSFSDHMADIVFQMTRGIRDLKTVGENIYKASKYLGERRTLTKTKLLERATRSVPSRKKGVFRHK